MLADRGAVEVDDRPELRRKARVALEKRPVAIGADEADLLALDRLGGRQCGRPRPRPHLRLGQLAEREHQAGEHVGPEHAEHVALVLGGVGRRGEHGRTARPVHDAGVVPGRQGAGAQERRGLGQHREADAAVAHDTRVRRQPGLVARHERLDHALTERLGGVDGQVRESQGMRARPGQPHGLR